MGINVWPYVLCLLVMGNIGLTSGGQVIAVARDRYLKALTALLKLASLQSAFFILDEEIKMTNRRVNALCNVSVAITLLYNIYIYYY